MKNEKHKKLKIALAAIFVVSQVPIVVYACKETGFPNSVASAKSNNCSFVPAIPNNPPLTGNSREADVSGTYQETRTQGPPKCVDAASGHDACTDMEWYVVAAERRTAPCVLNATKTGYTEGTWTGWSNYSYNNLGNVSTGNICPPPPPPPNEES